MSARLKLPVEAHEQKILDQADSNRATIIIGTTGCGKSTQVPKMLRRHFKGRVLCVQPRRMATVAVATRVAEELRVNLGGNEVGYHIGAACQAKLDVTELLFVTAGIFLEQLKSHGAGSLLGFCAVVIDEVHERSCENDLGLACLVQLALHSKELRALRIVLMSATADVRRYREFVRPLCDQGHLPGSVGIGDSATVYSVQLRYLKDAMAKVGCSTSMAMFEKPDRAAFDALVELLAALTEQLVLEVHEGSTVLVFLPTFAMIEALHRPLERALPGVPLYVLHSSVDMDDCMAALLGEDGATARVVLASAVAESSITIKKVAHVIDSCRACEIHWAPASGLSTPQIVWTSQAQAMQRAGRTGRTNDGVVWQLVTPSQYHGFAEFELASMQLQLLRKEVLLLTCASSKLLTDARKVLFACLDPPKAEVVERAEQHLMSQTLIERQPSGRRSASGKSLPLQPTHLGRLVDVMPLDIECSKLVIAGAFLGLLDEAVVLAVLRCQQPMVLKREPNRAKEYEQLVGLYGPKGPTRPTGSRDESFAEDEMLANLAAVASFQAWQTDRRRLRRARQAVTDARSGLEGERVKLVGLKSRPEINGQHVEVGAFNQLKSRYAVTLESGEGILVRRVNFAEPEAEWCRARQLSHAALLAAARTAEHVLSSLFRCHPPLLQRHLTAASARGLRPSPREAEADNPRDGLFWLFYEARDERLLRKLLQSLRVPKDRHKAPEPAGAPARCFFFERGCCTIRGCKFEHGKKEEDTRELCRFAVAGTCRFGAKCKNRHPDEQTATDGDPEVAMLQEQLQMGLGSLMPLYQKAELLGVRVDGPEANCWPAVDYTHFSSVVLLGEGDFSFAAWLAARSRKPVPHGDGTFAVPETRVVATAIQSEAMVLAAHPSRAAQALSELRRNGGVAVFDVDACRLDQLVPEELQPAECLVWNMPFSGVEQTEPNQLLMRGFFGAALRCAEQWLACGAPPLMVYVTVGINQFADWGLLAAARDALLELVSVHQFEPNDHAGYTPRRNDRDDPFEVGGTEVRTYGFIVDAARVLACAHDLERRAQIFAKLDRLAGD